MQLTGAMTVVVLTSLVRDKDSISEAKLGDRILVDVELTLALAVSSTKIKNSKNIKIQLRTSTVKS